MTENGNIHLGICAVGMSGELTITSRRRRRVDNNNTTGFIITVEGDDDDNEVTALDFEQSVPTANISDLNS
jgi:hypothetical protein